MNYKVRSENILGFCRCHMPGSITQGMVTNKGIVEKLGPKGSGWSGVYATYSIGPSLWF